MKNQTHSSVRQNNFEFMHLKKRGRPKTNFKTVSKTSQAGTKENETRATFIVDEAVLESLKTVAHWERSSIKEAVAQALKDYLSTKQQVLTEAAEEKEADTDRSTFKCTPRLRDKLEMKAKDLSRAVCNANMRRNILMRSVLESIDLIPVDISTCRSEKELRTLYREYFSKAAQSHARIH